MYINLPLTIARAKRPHGLCVWQIIIVMWCILPKSAWSLTAVGSSAKSVTDQHGLFHLHRSVYTKARIILTAIKMAHKDLCWLRRSTNTGTCCWKFAVSPWAGPVLIVYDTWTQICPVSDIGQLRCTKAKFQPCLAGSYCTNYLTRYPKYLTAALQGSVSICDLLQHAVHATAYFLMNSLLNLWPPWSHMTSTDWGTCTHFKIHYASVTFWIRSSLFLGTGAVRPKLLKWPARAFTAE